MVVAAPSPKPSITYPPPQPQPVQWLPAENEMAKRSGDKNGRPEQSPQERREEEQAVETGELVGQT